MRHIYHHTVIIGTGCAGYACACNLKRLGVDDTVIICENAKYGTSRNTGSDKQTYYKLSLCGNEQDSVYKMAKQMYSFGGIDGAKALCEAAGSVQCFMELVRLGVPFPKNEYGEFVGYKTDHDPCKRATSAGPLTSKYMTEALEAQAKKLGVEVIEGLIPVKIITENSMVKGCVFFDQNGEPCAVLCDNLVFATGGEASMFENSVYPESQRGAMGVLINAGVPLVNFNHWQFGIASTGFRWNLSGSYQQVIPRYVSTDENGAEHEFLRDSLTDEEIFEYTFLKGYEWPFDARKISASSKIDLLIINEGKKGRKVYLDYTKNPSGYSVSKLSEKASEYLENSNAFAPTPAERLKLLNEKAYLNYINNGIDLSKELLPIDVCVQHQNGGAKVNDRYETNIKNLYVIGEAAGVFGAYRPGGSALNSTQVGALRCAEQIAKFKSTDKKEYESVENILSNKIPLRITGDLELYEKWQRITSEICGVVRNEKEIRSYIELLKNDISACKDYKTAEMLSATLALYESCAFACREIGSHGSVICVDENGKLIEAKNENADKKIVYKNSACSLESPTEIPESPQWFEAVWKSLNNN